MHPVIEVGNTFLNLDGKTRATVTGVDHGFHKQVQFTSFDIELNKIMSDGEKMLLKPENFFLLYPNKQ